MAKIKRCTFSSTSITSQVELVDLIAERVQLIGGVSIAMASDVAETTQIERPLAAGRRRPCNCRDYLMHTRSLFAKARMLARRAFVIGDDGTNDLVASEALRTNELQAWCLSEHLVNMPLVKA